MKKIDWNRGPEILAALSAILYLVATIGILVTL